MKLTIKSMGKFRTTWTKWTTGINPQLNQILVSRDFRINANIFLIKFQKTEKNRHCKIYWESKAKPNTQQQQQKDNCPPKNTNQPSGKHTERIKSTLIVIYFHIWKIKNKRIDKSNDSLGESFYHNHTEPPPPPKKKQNNNNKSHLQKCLRNKQNGRVNVSETGNEIVAQILLGRIPDVIMKSATSSRRCAHPN